MIGSLARAFPAELLTPEMERACLGRLSEAAGLIAAEFVRAGHGA